MQTIRIDGITRVEGHGKITIQLDDMGTVQDAHLHVLQFRGFEKFCEGRPFYEMPSLTAVSYTHLDVYKRQVYGRQGLR